MDSTGSTAGLSGLSVPDLLRLSRQASLELRSRGILRTDNAPLGDIAEFVVCKAYRGVLAPNSEKSFDLVDAKNRRIQVKARTLLSPYHGAVEFSPFRSFDFDVSVLVLFDRDSMDVLSALEADADAETIEEAARFSRHVNGHVLTSSRLLTIADGQRWRDVTELVRQAYTAL